MVNRIRVAGYLYHRLSPSLQGVNPSTYFSRPGFVRQHYKFRSLDCPVFSIHFFVTSDEHPIDQLYPGVLVNPFQIQFYEPLVPELSFSGVDLIVPVINRRYELSVVSINTTNISAVRPKN